MGGHGSFSGNPKTEWLEDPDGRDRDMKLIEDFWYDDPAGRRWQAPAGSIINGASIPQLFWTTAGSPYTDDYRRASIIHDVACADPSVDRDEADLMFLEACQAGGCSTSQARAFYAGVCLGKWFALHFPYDSHSKTPESSGLTFEASEEARCAQDEFELLAAELAALPEDASIQEIRAVIDARFPPSPSAESAD